MKRFFTIAIILLPMLFACTDSSKSGQDSATGVVLSKDKVELAVGESVTITASVMPESLGISAVWSVIDADIADVENGTITAKAQGVTYVIAATPNGNKRAACMVNVTPALQYSVVIKNQMGQTVNDIYGYPGMTAQLSAVSDDEQTHTFTWSIEDSAVGTISEDGLLTLAASASSNDASYIYDAQSYLKVVTEDGCGCKIPVRSSMLKGVRIGADYQPYGTPATVIVSETYPISVMYQRPTGIASVPADAVNFELSNTTDFTLTKEDGTYKITTGAITGVSSKLSVSLAGSSEKVEIAQLKIDKVYRIKALFDGVSSSTLTFTWTEGISAEDDIAKPYTITLYKDEDCTDILVSYSITSSNACWKGRQPRFVFSGLDAATTYWFQVKETGNEAAYESAVISGTTLPFSIVEPSETPASVGDIILAEDFSELLWMADETTLAAGYDVGSNSASSFSDRTADSFVGTTGQYCSPERLITGQSTAKKESGLRLGKWAQGQYARLYVGPGYVYISTYSYPTHLITPPLNNIPDGATAKVKVTIHAAGYKSGSAALAVQPKSTSFNIIGSGTQTNKNKLNLTSNVETITFEEGGLTKLKEYTVEISGLVQGDRIAFGPTSETTKDNSNMMILSDMTIEILELN